MSTRGARSAVCLSGALALTLLLTGCSSTGGDADPTAPAPTLSSPTTAATSDASDSSEPDQPSAPAEGYLPVPDDVTLTDPGTRLGLKEPAVAAW